MELDVRDLTPTQAKYKLKIGLVKRKKDQLENLVVQTEDYDLSPSAFMICLELGTNKTQNVCNRRKLLLKF